MNRRQFAKLALGIAVGSASVLVHGCGSPTPDELEEEQTNCEHEWEKAPSGEIRCKKCGVYKKD